MSGPFARMLIQVGVAATAVFAKAFMQAYQQAAANPHAARAARDAAKRTLRKTMDEHEALQVLNLSKRPATAAEYEETFKRYFEANDPNNGGSFYVQSKVFRAKEALDLLLEESAEKLKSDDDDANDGSK